MSKKIKLAIVLLIAITLAAAAYIFAYSLYGYINSEDYTYSLDYFFGRTGIYLPPYHRLDRRFQREIPEELYTAETVDEYISLFEKINSVDCGPNFFQELSVNSTDELKRDLPLEIEDSSGRKYILYHHVDVASTLFFEPVIVGWTIDITEISPTSAVSEDNPKISGAAQDSKAVDFSSKQNALKDYIGFARSETSNTAFENIYECVISLQNIYGDEKPEMIIGIKGSQPFYNGEYYFTTDENGEPVCMGECYDIHDEFYTDGEFIYAVKDGEAESINTTTINKLQYPIESAASPDLADYRNSDASEFIYDTHMYFLKYDNEDWDSEKQSWKDPEKTAALFYCEDSGLYEAYSVSKQILELTSIEISDYINQDGNHIYSYLPGENYLVSRREYENIKSRAFEILVKVTDEPEISSGWINIDDVDDWSGSLA